MNASYQASLVNRHIRRFTGNYKLLVKLAKEVLWVELKQILLLKAGHLDFGPVRDRSR